MKYLLLPLYAVITFGDWLWREIAGYLPTPKSQCPTKPDWDSRTQEEWERGS